MGDLLVRGVPRQTVVGTPDRGGQRVEVVSRHPPLKAGWRQCLLEEERVKVFLDHGQEHLMSFGAEVLHIPMWDFWPGCSAA